MQLTITHRDGSEHVVLYDEIDAELIARHHWSLLNAGYAVTSATQKVVNGRGTSRYCGVSWNSLRQRWIARTYIDG